MLKFLLTPKWIALTIIAILLQPAFYELSQWQWRRLHQRETYNANILNNEKLNIVALKAVIGKSDSQTRNPSIKPTLEWRRITVKGVWDSSNQVLVRKQSYESNLGFWVITPITDQEGNTILVNRGWIAANGSATTSPIVQPLSNKQVEIIGRVRIVSPRNNPKPNDLPNGQVDRIVPTEIVNSRPVVSNAYLELIATTPKPKFSDLSLIQPPEISEGPHRSYALQWIFFAIMTVIGYTILVRKEIQTIKENAEKQRKANKDV